jgi:hypothetical protein
LSVAGTGRFVVFRDPGKLTDFLSQIGKKALVLLLLILPQFFRKIFPNSRLPPNRI